MCVIEEFFPLFGRFKDEKTIAVAVSGGSDSLALLILAHHWQQSLSDPKPEIIALTVDHGLRKAAKDEAQYVAELCQSLNIPHHILTWQHLQNGKPNSAIAEKAREARYALLAERAQQAGANHVLLAHTKNDQAETVLMRALHRADHRSNNRSNHHSNHRSNHCADQSADIDPPVEHFKMGTGFRGLAAMADHVAHESGLIFARPLLRFQREELRKILKHQSIAWIDDPTNQDVTLERPRIRAFLNDPASPFSIATLSKFAHVISRWRKDAATRSADLIKNAVMPAKAEAIIKKGVVQINPAEFKKAPLSIQLLTLRALIAAIGGGNYLPPLEPSQRLLDLIRSDAFKGASLGGAILAPIGGKDKRVELYREYRNINATQLSPPHISPPHMIWDGRFMIKLDKPPTPAVKIKALGNEGYDFLKAQENSFIEGQKQRHLLAHPSLWCGDQLIHLPLTDSDALNPDYHETIEQFQITPYIPAFERFKNPLDRPLRKALKTLMLNAYGESEKPYLSNKN